MAEQRIALHRGVEGNRPSGRRRFTVPLEFVSLVLLVAAWQLAATLFPSRHFPPPLLVATTMWDLTLDGRLLADMGKTLMRAAISFVCAMVLGTLIGIGLGRSRIADRLFASWVVVGLNIPAIVTAVILFIWLGLTEFALILAVTLNKLPVVITTIREGVCSFSRDYDELAAAFRIPPWRRLRLIMAPQLMPFLLAAARTGLALIWKIVLVFELLGSDGGIGFRIQQFFQFFDITGIFAYTAAFIIVVFAFEYLALRPLENHLLKWRSDRT